MHPSNEEILISIRHRSKEEWLDYRPWIPIVLIVLFPIFVEFPVWLFGLKTDPIWFNSAVVKDLSSGILNGATYEDPNVAWTSEALGHLAASDWVKHIIPWWNPYSGIGLPLAGEMQPGAFFLPFILLLLLHNGILWVKVALQIVSGLFTYLLLRELGLGRLACLTGSLLYSLNGTFALLPGPEAVIHPIPFLPLLLYGIEVSRKIDKRVWGVFFIAVSIAWLIFSGFPEASYIDGLMALIWALYRVIGANQRWTSLATRILYGGILGLMLAAPLILAFGEFLLSSDAFGTHLDGNISLPLAAAVPFFLPYVYGPLGNNHGNSELSIIWGNLGGYVGVLIIFVSLLGLKNKKERGLRILLVSWVLLSWAKTFGIPPFSSLMNHIPLLQQTAFYRYSCSSWELALIILAAFSLNDLKTQRPNLTFPFCTTAIILCASIYLAWPWRTFWGWGEDKILKVAVVFFAAILWAVAGLVLTRITFVLRGEKQRAVLAFLLVVDAAVFFIVPEMGGLRSGTVDRSAIHFLQRNLGLSRFYTLGPIQPNYSAYFEIGNINHIYVPVEINWARFVENNIFPPVKENQGVIFWPQWPYQDGLGVKYVRKFLSNYENLSVRYIVTNPGQGLIPAILTTNSPSGNEALSLLSGQTVRLSLEAPSQGPSGQNKITAIGIFQGNFGNVANGDMFLRVCSETACSSGKRSMVQSSDNAYFYVTLDPPLPAGPKTSLSITVSDQGGNKPFALWLWPSLPGQDQKMVGPKGIIENKSLRIAFRYNTRASSLKKVYSDKTMDIWETPAPKPYYTIHNGPCRLFHSTRETLDVECDKPAILIRRELYMSGWRSIVNRNSTPINVYQKIFQSINLPVGKSSIAFRFSPPHMKYAWGLFCLAAFILGGEIIRKVLVRSMPPEVNPSV